MDIIERTYTEGASSELGEALLSAWLHLSTSVNNSRIVSKLSYSESLVCNLLYRNQLNESDAPLTATQLCQKTKMLKSQMNRTLNQLEDRGMLRRERSSTDKRVFYIRLNPEALKDYEKQHEYIMAILNQIIAELGFEQAKETIFTLEKISSIADNLLQKGEKND